MNPESMPKSHKAKVKNNKRRPYQSKSIQKDKELEKWTRDFIERYRADLEALARK